VINGPTRRAALRALYDVGVVRASVINPGFDDLFRRDLASRTPAGTGQCDYRLTDQGVRFAKEAFE
jgi:hypothetical protein